MLISQGLNLVCRDLSNIDTVIVASVIVKVCRELNVCINAIPNTNYETKRNQFIKILINVLSEIKGVNNVDYFLDLTTNLMDNINRFYNMIPLEDPFMSNMIFLNDCNANDLPSLFNMKISSFNKSLYKETYKLFKNYHDNDEQERVYNLNNYSNFLRDNLRKTDY